MKLCIMQTASLLGLTVVVLIATAIFIRNKIKQD